MDGLPFPSGRLFSPWHCRSASQWHVGLAGREHPHQADPGHWSDSQHLSQCQMCPRSRPSGPPGPPEWEASPPRTDCGWKSWSRFVFCCPSRRRPSPRWESPAAGAGRDCGFGLMHPSRVGPWTPSWLESSPPSVLCPSCIWWAVRCCCPLTAGSETGLAGSGETRLPSPGDPEPAPCLSWSLQAKTQQKSLGKNKINPWTHFWISKISRQNVIFLFFLGGEKRC